MKKIFKSIVAVLCCGALFASCEQEAPEVNMSVDLASIDVEAQNPEPVAVALTTDATWILTCPDWITPSVTYGTGNSIISFQFATNYKDETTTTHARTGEIRISGGGTLTGKGAVASISVNQAGYTYVDPNPSLGGITDAEEFAAFIVAANSGGSLTRWTNEATGEILLLADIDISNEEIDWQALADATKTSNANNAASIVENTTPFEGVFNGDGHKITGFNPVVVLGVNQTFGLFQVAHNATIKNLELSGTFNVTAKDQADAGMLVGTAIHSTISNVKIGGKIVSAGTTAAKRFSIGGVCGYAYAGLIGEAEYGKTLFENCVVNADVEFDGGTNQANGATCAMYGGICGFATTPNAAAAHKVTIKDCVNNGNMNVKIGRCSGIIATANTGVILEDVTNNGDQVNMIANGRLGNIVCNISHHCTLKNCVNNGDLEATNNYTGTVGGIFALAGSATITGIEGGGNYGTIKTLSGAGKYVGLLWANHNNTFPTKNITASGRIIVDGVERAISEANYMENIGYMKDKNCVSNILWVAPK